MQSHDKIYDMLVQQDEITWQSIIYELVKSEEMDPWDINVCLLSEKFIETINKLEEMNFFLSGKILLASAVLLKIKSNKLLKEDLPGFENLLYPSDEDEFTETKGRRRMDYNPPPLTIKSPQARKRTVTVEDLIGALQKALEVKNRRLQRKVQEKRHVRVKIPIKNFDITGMIKELYEKVRVFFGKKEHVSFNKILPEGASKDDKINIFIPLLHLHHQDKVTVDQPEHFGDIDIHEPGTFDEGLELEDEENLKQS